MIQIISTITEMQQLRRTWQGKKVGFVPTMGALHEGHLSLVQRALEENEICVVSIFVNPTQFDQPEDLKKYPRTFEEDSQMLNAAGVHYIFSPNYEELYPDHYRFKVTESELSQKLCGAHRKGHFDGVLTVVMKLLNLISADKAYFGEKDFQQLTLISEMAQSFFMKTQIVACPTLREQSGLAMSSRNRRLSEEQRLLAQQFAKTLANKSLTKERVIAELEKQNIKVDYIEEMLGRRLGAVKIYNSDCSNEVRLIDNLPWESQ